MSFRGDGKRDTLKSKSTLFIYLFSIDKIDQLILIRRAPLKQFWNSDADENYAYCEFFEGSTIDGDEEHEAYYFKEYYDLDDDPYQLDNIYDQLGMEYEILRVVSPAEYGLKTIFITGTFYNNFYSIEGNDFKNQLRTELTRLRHCKGRDCSCSIDRGGIDGCGESGAPAGLKPTAKGNRNRISG